MLKLSAHDHQRGLVLVAVLWIVTLLALQVSIFNLTVRDAASLAGNELAVLRGEALAMGGVEMAVAHMLARNPERRWIGDGSMHGISFGGASLSIVINDETARIDINEADAELLASVLQPYAQKSGSLAQWVDRIMDWRDADSERRLQGAEALDYQRSGVRHGPSNGPFRDPSELGRVLGFSRETALELAGFLTVFGGEGKVNPLVASRKVLLMLPGADAAEIDRALELRRQGGEAAFGVPAALIRHRNWLTGRKGPAYRIEVTVRGDAQPAIGTAEAVVLIGRDAATPFRMLSWRYEPRMWEAEARVGK